MKNKIRFIGVGLIALLLAFTGCSNPLDERPDESPEPGSSGNLVISLGNLDARTLGPIASDIAGLSYRLVLRGYDELIEEDVDFSESSVERPIAPGLWTVEVYAFTDNKPVAKGNEPVEVLAGETKAVSITLQPVTDRDVAGKFEYDIVFPEPTPDFYYRSGTLSLTPYNPPNSSTPTPVIIDLLEPGKEKGDLELPAGRYTLDISLVNGRGIGPDALKATRRETVYLYPDLTTKAEFTFYETDFAADMYLRGSAWVNNYGSARYYTPTQVQLKPYNWDGDEIKLKTAPYNGGWELLVPSEDIGGPDHLPAVELRFTVENGGETLLSNWETVYLQNIQGNSWVSLSTTVYSITKENDPNFNSIEGVSGIAHNSDAIAGSQVSLKIVPKSGYGMIGNSVRDNYGNSFFPGQDGAISFTMPDRNVTVYADFFQVRGMVSISPNDAGYKPVRIEAYENYPGNQIGTGPINTNGEWVISIPPDYIYTGTGTIYFKVFSESEEADKQPQNYVISASVDLRGGTPVYLSIPLFRVSNFRVTAITDKTVTFAWDKADWSTGYRIHQKFTEESTTWERYVSCQSTKTEETVEITDLNFYAINSYYTGNSVGGEMTVLEYILPAPKNLRATGDQNSQITLSWDSVARADSYEVYRDGGYVRTTDSTSYTDSGLWGGSTYSYTVKAKISNKGSDDYWGSDFSAPVLVTSN